MRRSAWIFFASIFLPSLGLAWLAIRSVQDQQVVLEHQQVIISQNITDALAKSVQDQMDAVRADFVKTTQGLLDANPPPENLARDFNRKIQAAWPLAEIGFAVNVNGEIYSPKSYDDAGTQTFRNENDRFLSNRENVEVYSNSLFNMATNGVQNFNGSNATKSFNSTMNSSLGAVAAGLNAAQYRVEPSTVALPAVNLSADQKHVDAPAVPSKEAGAVLEQADAASSASADGAKKSEAATDLASAAPTGTAQANSITTKSTPDAEKMPAHEASADKTRMSTIRADETGKDAASVASANSDSVAPAAAPAAPVPAPAIARLSSENTPTAPAATPVTEPQGGSTKAVPPLAGSFGAIASKPSPAPAAATPPNSTQIGSISASSLAAAKQAPPPENQDQLDRVEARLQKVQRQVIPQRMPMRDSAPVSNTLPADSDFRRIIGTDTSGELARFLENKLRLIVWSHATPDAPIVFGAQLDQARLVEALKSSFHIPELQAAYESASFRERTSAQFCVAILDDTGRPVARSVESFEGDWKHPFVATEIGEVLPHWEAALYQIDPQQISRAARTAQLTLGLIVLLLVAAIAAGGSIIAADVRRQVRLAQQKTDFVSNVSHELKTPLTSIRMFADLLAEKRVPDEERQATYLRIIAAEASRLTRLINNVLDFARLERGAKNAAPGEHRACDLVEAVRDVIDTCGPHLEAAGMTFRHEIEADALPIHGDRDALAQIILNLVSNAEKYGGGDILVRARRQETASGALGCVDVLDRGAGIPAREVKTIFEPFQRLDDSLSSGIPGSGLGLTLARRMARAHGGDVTYSTRAGGGSCFTLTIPLEKSPT